MLTVLVPVLAAVVGQQPGANPAPEAGPSKPLGYVLGDERWHSDPEVLWPGFLSGLRGYEGFYNPVGNPCYFEPPTNESGVRFLYLRHTFPEGSVLGGGDLTIAAVQARLAITERLAFIATKDGYSWLDADNLPEEEGWNALSAGLKYVFYEDRESQTLAAVGFRYMFDTGDDDILQSGVQELSPFVSFAKGWGDLRLMANVTDRIPFDGDDGNNILQWDIHADYEIAPGIAPMIELHGLHYLMDGDRTELPIGGLDYTNLGSTDVAGSTVITLGFGGRIKLNPHASIGGVYEVPLTNKDADIFNDRVVLDFMLTW